MSDKPNIPEGWAELAPGEIIRTDDKVWVWGNGPWLYVGGALVGTRYQRPTSEIQSHWTTIRERNT